MLSHRSCEFSNCVLTKVSELCTALDMLEILEPSEGCGRKEFGIADVESNPIECG